MFLSTDNFKFNYKETVVVESLPFFFNLCTAEENKELLDLVLSEKTNFITADYDSESQIAGCYKLFACEPYNTDETEIVYDASTLTYAYKGCEYKATTLPTYGKRYTVRQFGAVGYTQAELDGMTDSEKGNVAASNAAALNSAANMCAQIGREYNRAIELSFESNLIYLIDNTIYFSSDTDFIGNNAIIRLFNNTNKAIDAFSNKQVLNTDDDYGNVGFYDLTIEGRYGNSVPIADQAVHCSSIDQFGNVVSALSKSVTFVNFTAKDMCYGIHINNNAYYDIPLYWTFDNCEFLHTATGFMLTGVSKLSLLNSHIDNSLSQAKGEHCIYVSEKCSYLTVDNCLLENSAGGAIHQLYGFPITTSEYNHDNRYTNLTIRSCLTALNIGASSKNTTIENIHMYNIVRGIKLHSCINTVIKNIYGTGSSYPNPRNYANGVERIFDGRGEIDKPVTESIEWLLINIRGKVSATISDCYFKFSSATFSTAKYDNTKKGSENLTELEAFYKYHHEGEDNWFNDGVIEADVKFENCIFDSTFNKIYNKDPNDQWHYNSSLGCTETINWPEKNIQIIYKNNIKFCNCQFLLNYDTIKDPFICLKGNNNFHSQYLFDSCKMFIFIEDLITQYNISIKSYFVHASSGSEVTIKNCNFYKNCDFYRISGNSREKREYYSCVDDATTFICNNNINNL